MKEENSQLETREKPLEGLLVVSVEQAVAAPLCTARLMDAGARVIKIERSGGDFARGYDTAAKGESSYFVWINQGKESLILDFKQPDDKLLLECLIAKADILVQNLAPGALARAGFGLDILRKRHPMLITCDISGYGNSEEMAHMKAYDFLVQAESGLVDVSGGVNELGRIGVSVCDIGAGMAAHAAILEALLLRARTGRGSGLEISLFDVAAEWMCVPLIHNDYGLGPPTRQGLQHPSIAPYGAFKTKDDTNTIVSIQNEREWQRFCELVLGDKTIADDKRFSSNTARVANRDELNLCINKIVGQLTADQFRSRLIAGSIAQGRINTVDELSRHPALRRMEVQTSENLKLTIPAQPARWTGYPSDRGKGVPLKGEHTQQIRDEFIGTNKVN